MADSPKKRTRKTAKPKAEETVVDNAQLEAVDAEMAETEAAETETAQETAAEPETIPKETAETTEAPAKDERELALEAAVAKQEEYLAMAQRVQADFENFRRRNQNLRKESFDDGAKAFATTLLPVIDNLERAIAAAENTTDASLKEGVEMIHRQLTDAFEKRGITPIDRKGQPFDPNLENAVMQGSPDDGEPGTVCEVFQKGYQMEGAVLRYAMVKVVPE
ncbi:MAG: nucleotide exchange factor GrpE [Clostridiales bacterium]|nr:nucleotide exchange factor GrpE [Clostridiales bacterium]